MLQSYPAVQTSPSSLKHDCTSQGHFVSWPVAAENHCYKALTPAVHAVNTADTLFSFSATDFLWQGLEEQEL